ncbi:hypothetical protein M3205_16715 [Cytobacillus firmus]|nr:hypothetical protein [Cytobacillus firmus]MCM3707355.1 hypothetical protein [Cytobacillus firmus]
MSDKCGKKAYIVLGVLLGALIISGCGIQDIMPGTEFNDNHESFSKIA